MLVEVKQLITLAVVHILILSKSHTLAKQFSGYLEQYNQIIESNKNQPQFPFHKIKQTIKHDSKGNDSAEYVQRYLEKSRRKATNKLPRPGGQINGLYSHSETKSNSGSSTLFYFLYKS